MPGWHACGSIMDFIQRCYKSSMRPFPDRPDVVVPGQWYWCCDGAKPVPFPSTFFSLGNVDRSQWDKGVGEVLYSNVLVKGVQRPEFTGQNVCGSADVWRYGAPYSALGTPTVDSRGVPLCCKGFGEAGQGGLAIGGLGVETYRCVDTCQGGLSIGGYGKEVGFFAERAQGGLRVGGTVQDAWFVTEIGQGGLRAGGYGKEVGFAAERGQGGLTLGGFGMETGFPAETGQGGLSIGGYGLEVGFAAERGQGGLSIGGNVKDASVARETGQGGLSIGGYGKEVGFFAERAQGGLRIGGTVQDAWTAKETSNGGLRIGGTVGDKEVAADTGQGGLAFGGVAASEVLILPLTSFNCNALNAAGTTQGTAAAIADDTVVVTTTNTNYGVILPAGCYRVVVSVAGGSPHAVSVYPPVGAQLGILAANAPLTFSAGTAYLFVEVSATQWRFVQLT